MNNSKPSNFISFINIPTACSIYFTSYRKCTNFYISVKKRALMCSFIGELEASFIIKHQDIISLQIIAISPLFIVCLCNKSKCPDMKFHNLVLLVSRSSDPIPPSMLTTSLLKLLTPKYDRKQGVYVLK